MEPSETFQHEIMSLKAVISLACGLWTTTLGFICRMDYLLVTLLAIVALSSGHPECLTRDEDLPRHLPRLEAYGFSTKFAVQSTTFTRSIPIQYHIVEPSGTSSITDYDSNKATYQSQWGTAIQTHLAEYNTGFAVLGASFHLLPVKYIASDSILHNCFAEDVMLWRGLLLITCHCLSMTLRNSGGCCT